MRRSAGQDLISFRMSKQVLSLLLVSALCALALSASLPPQKDLDALARNAVYESRMAKVETELMIFTIQHETLEKVKKDEKEKRECVESVKEEALSEAEQLRAKTIDTLQTAVADAKASSEGQDPQEVLQKLDYPNLKKSAQKSLKSLISTWFPTVETKFEDCLKKGSE